MVHCAEQGTNDPAFLLLHTSNNSPTLAYLRFFITFLPHAYNIAHALPFSYANKKPRSIGPYPIPIL